MHQMIREALARVIHDAGGFETLVGADTGHEAVKICRDHAPDILVAAIELEDGNGIEVAREVLRVKPETKVILIQSSHDEDVTLRALRSGALGLVCTREPSNLLIEALRTVAQGRPYVAPPTWDVVLNRVKKMRPDAPPQWIKKSFAPPPANPRPHCSRKDSQRNRGQTWPDCE
jgi:DNA-binding NarL/FixJ family response regulator